MGFVRRESRWHGEGLRDRNPVPAMSQMFHCPCEDGDQNHSLSLSIVILLLSFKIITKTILLQIVGNEKHEMRIKVRGSFGTMIT
jgi:hypothetical protein